MATMLSERAGESDAGQAQRRHAETAEVWVAEQVQRLGRRPSALAGPAFGLTSESGYTRTPWPRQNDDRSRTMSRHTAPLGATEA